MSDEPAIPHYFGCLYTLIVLVLDVHAAGPEYYKSKELFHLRM